MSVTLHALDQEDSRLRQPSAFLLPADLRRRDQQLEISALLDFVLASDVMTSEKASGEAGPRTVGLSGCQVGIMKQICVVDLSIGKRGYHDVHILVNPQITWSSKAQVERVEGCVNFEDIWGVTKRSRSIRVSAVDRSGNEISLKLNGWPAILLQHEIDHLHGRLFIDRLLDPKKAHKVAPEEFTKYRRSKAKDWNAFVDMSAQAR